ncbi:MAG: hypothetical protein Unbinned5784contig1000_5 [Prokaryotic dsDNA virus sp.]|nr:MAG: hypothetical protein Unbinned5784contig1000_5 [Prokaryotic dsDNA virus sp.]
MLPRNFYQACQQHDWNWAESSDDLKQSRGYSNEQKLRAIAEESPACREIYLRVKAEKQEVTRG